MPAGAAKEGTAQTMDTLPLLVFKKIARDSIVDSVRIDASAAAVASFMRVTSV